MPTLPDCPRCRKSIDAGAVKCAACGLPHHLACMYPPHSGCAACGCTDAPVVLEMVAAAPGSRTGPGPLRRHLANVTLAVLVIGLVASTIQAPRGGRPSGLVVVPSHLDRASKTQIASGEGNWTELDLGDAVCSDLLLDVGCGWPRRDAPAPALVAEVMPDGSASGQWLRLDPVSLLPGAGRVYHLLAGGHFRRARLCASNAEAPAYLGAMRALPPEPPPGIAVPLQHTVALRNIDGGSAVLAPEHAGPGLVLPLAALRGEDLDELPAFGSTDKLLKLCMRPDGGMRIHRPPAGGSLAATDLSDRIVPHGALGGADSEPDPGYRSWIEGIGAWTALQAFHERHPLAEVHNGDLRKGFALMPGGVVWAMGFGQVATYPPELAYFEDPRPLSSIAELEVALSSPRTLTEFHKLLEQPDREPIRFSDELRRLAETAVSRFRDALRQRFALNVGDRFVVAPARDGAAAVLRLVGIGKSGATLEVRDSSGTTREITVPVEVLSPARKLLPGQPVELVRVSLGNGGSIGGVTGAGPVAAPSPAPSALR